jgi:hypothetical protein
LGKGQTKKSCQLVKYWKLIFLNSLSFLPHFRAGKKSYDNETAGRVSPSGDQGAMQAPFKSQFSQNIYQTSTIINMNQ